MIIIMMTEITMTLKVMKMAFMFIFHMKFHVPMHFYSINYTITSSREAHVNVTNSLIKINFRIRTRNQSVLQ
jgi:hypothetical protein